MVRRLLELGEDVAHDLLAQYGWLVPVRRACGNVQHVACAGFNRMAVEAVADAAGQDEDRMAGLAPIGLGRAWRVGARSW